MIEIMSGFQKILFLLRAFFPSWKFFDDPGSLPELSFQLDGQSDWTKISRQTRWQWSHFFINPAGNWNHALGSLIDQLLNEALKSSPEDLSQNTAYRLVQNWVRQQIIQNSFEAQGRQFQFKISIALPSPDDVVISPWHEV